jgi:hypothetical protein
MQVVFHSPAQAISDQEIMAEPINSSKSNTILMDVLRTRSSFFSKEIKVEMEKMLNHFCRLNKLEYKQGLNEILAPFAYFRTVGYSVGKCYALFRSFFDQYCLNFYYDKVRLLRCRILIVWRSFSKWLLSSSSTTTPLSLAISKTTKLSHKFTVLVG